MTEQELLSALREDIILGGLSDIIGVWEFEAFFRRVAPNVTIEDVRRMSLVIIRELLDRDLFVVGKMMSKAPFLEPWNMSIDEALRKIESEWQVIGRRVDPGDIGYFRATAKGKDLARQVLKDRKTG